MHINKFMMVCLLAVCALNFAGCGGSGAHSVCEPLRQVQGTMIDSKGMPVPGASVRLMPADTAIRDAFVKAVDIRVPESVRMNSCCDLSAVADESGAFTIPNVPEGDYILKAESEKRNIKANLPLTLRADKQTINVTLTPVWSVSGHVNFNKKGMDGVILHLSKVDADNSLSTDFFAVTSVNAAGEHGCFTFDGLYGNTTYRVELFDNDKYELVSPEQLTFTLSNSGAYGDKLNNIELRSVVGKNISNDKSKSCIKGTVFIETVGEPSGVNSLRTIVAVNTSPNYSILDAGSVASVCYVLPKKVDGVIKADYSFNNLPIGTYDIALLGVSEAGYNEFLSTTIPDRIQIESLDTTYENLNFTVTEATEVKGTLKEQNKPKVNAVLLFDSKYYAVTDNNGEFSVKLPKKLARASIEIVENASSKKNIGIVEPGYVNPLNDIQNLVYSKRQQAPGEFQILYDTSSEFYVDVFDDCLYMVEIRGSNLVIRKFDEYGNVSLQRGIIPEPVDSPAYSVDLCYDNSILYVLCSSSSNMVMCSFNSSSGSLNISSDFSASVIDNVKQKFNMLDGNLTLSPFHSSRLIKDGNQIIISTFLKYYNNSGAEASGSEEFTVFLDWQKLKDNASGEFLLKKNNKEIRIKDYYIEDGVGTQGAFLALKNNLTSDKQYIESYSLSYSKLSDIVMDSDYGTINPSCSILAPNDASSPVFKRPLSLEMHYNYYEDKVLFNVDVDDCKANKTFSLQKLNNNIQLPYIKIGDKVVDDFVEPIMEPVSDQNIKDIISAFGITLSEKEALKHLTKNEPVYLCFEKYEDGMRCPFYKVKDKLWVLYRMGDQTSWFINVSIVKSAP